MLRKCELGPPLTEELAELELEDEVIFEVIPEPLLKKLFPPKKGEELKPEVTKLP